MSGTPFVVFDLIDLGLLALSKQGRPRLGPRGDADLASFYDGFFTDLDDSVMESGDDLRKAVRLGGVRSAVRACTKPGDCVLDVGAGCGDNLQSLTELAGLKLVGVEFARSSCRRAQRRAGDAVQLVQGSALALPFATGVFDALTCIEVLEHLEDDRSALREMRRVLKPGGRLILTVPHRHWFPLYRELMGHERHYDRQTLEALLREAGFEVERHIPNFPSWHRASDYAYALCRAAGLISSRLGGEREPQRVRIPGMRRPLLGELNAALERLREREAQLDYRLLDQATSVVARLRSES